jgi:hypothetical protein
LPVPGAGPVEPGAPGDQPAATESVRWTAPIVRGRPTAVAGDAEGVVYVAIAPVEEGASRASRLVRFASGGEPTWSVELTGGPATHLAATADGDALVALCGTSACGGGIGDRALTVSRFAPSGALRWSTSLDGERFESFDADPSGRVVAIVATGDELPRVVGLGDEGQIVFDAPAAAGTRRAAAGVGGGVVTAGHDPATSRPFFQGHAPDGATRWRRNVDAPRGSIDRVALAPDGTIALAGWFDERLRWGAVTHARDVVGIAGFVAIAAADGAARWSSVDPELRPSGTEPSYVGFGAAGSVVIHTTTSRAGRANLRAYARTGTAASRYDFRGGVDGTTVARVAVGRNGDLVVAAHGAADAPFAGLPGVDGYFVAVLAPAGP